MTTYRRITLGVAISLILLGCSSEPHQSAPITSIGDHSGGGNYPVAASSSSTAANTSASQNSMAMDTSRPNIVYQGQGAASSPSVAAATPQTQSGNPFSQSKPANQVTSANTAGDRIVYNRSYSDIPKGSYNGGSTYTVSRGDTLFYIAWITGNDYRDLAQKNNISEPYALVAGQTLQVGGGANTGGMLAGNTTSNNTSNSNNKVLAPANTGSQNQPTVVDSGNSGGYTAQTSNKQPLPSTSATVAAGSVTAGSTAAAVSSTGSTTNSANNASSSASTTPVKSSTTASNVRWRWPVDGKIIDNFSTAEGGNKGIDIAGTRGQPVVAAADGRVVYAGNALRGYGNLIIIKHNDDYLSAYAHNDTMSVAEQQEVKAGQKIATMGSTGTSSVRLHFEIRYKGKSVNPLQHLPQR